MVQHTKRFPRLVTALLTTPGVEGAAGVDSSPLSLLDDRCKLSVPRAKLSLRLLGIFGQPKYPLVDSMLRSGGGDVVRGLGIALCPLALLELFLLRPLRSRVLWKFFIRLAVAGEKLLDHATPGLATVRDAYGV